MVDEKQLITRLSPGSKALLAQAFPTGSDFEVIVEVVRQSDGALLVSRYLRRRDNGGIHGSETCFYCDGKLLGCIKCPNNDPLANCTTGQIGCSS
jgi:hypothetical protein